MSVTTAEVVAGDDEAGDHPGIAVDRRRLADVVVARLHDEYGVDPDELRDLAEAAYAAFAAAPVQAFVPILVEKRLRAACSSRRAADGGSAREP